MQIRRARPADLPALAAIEAASYPAAEAADEQTLQRRLAAFPDCFWLLEQNGETVAFINGMASDARDLTDEMYARAELHRPDGKRLMIFSVVTAPQHRHKGYACALMHRVTADARAAGRHEIVLTCKAALLPFYAQFGFCSEGVSASEHGGAVWYQMRLSLADTEQ